MGDKISETKLPEFANSELDSGFLSGPIDELPGDSGEIPVESDNQSVDKNVKSACDDQSSELDSGLVEVSDCLVELSIEDTQPAIKEGPKEHSLPAHTSLPPLSVLFKQDDDGDTQLHIAAIHGCKEAISTLIRVCPNKEWFNIPNCYGQTALHLAVLSGNPVVTRMLVIAGASVEVRNRRGETPLHIATKLGNIECMHSLLKKVDELPHRRIFTVLNQKNYNGQACVHVAAAAGNIEAIKALLHYRADFKSTENLSGRTALHVAAQRGDARLVQLLLRAAGGPVPRDYGGRSPRRLARRTPAAAAFAGLADSSDSDSDSDDDMYDSDNDSLFEKLRDSLNPINVA